MATGLGALTEGFQSGYKFSRSVQRNKIIDKALDFEVAGMDESRKAREAAYKRLGFDFKSDHEFQPQSLGSKLIDKFKGMFSKPAQAINPQDQPSPEAMQQSQFTQPPPDQSSMPGMGGMGGMGGMQPMASKHGGAIARYAHGGATRRMEHSSAIDNRMMKSAPAMPMADGGKADKYEVPEERKEKYRRMIERAQERGDSTGFSRGPDGGDIINYMRSVKDQFTAENSPIQDIGRNAIPNIQRRMDEWRPKGIAADRAVLDAEGAGATGAAIRSNIAEGARGIGQLGMGLLEDTGVMPLVKGIGGFLTGDSPSKIRDEKTAAVQALPKEDTPEEQAKSIASNAAQPSGEAPPNQVANAAPTTVAEEIEQSEDPIIDMSQVREIRPEDMPNKGQKEWEEERNFWAAQAVANGENPLDAMKAVDEKQMRGFTMYGQQAFQLLRAGNAPAAVNALYAAYQYFPNGVDVRFGIMKGKDGSPVIIGMGTDEETGEPNGKPTVITAESLAVQIENMSNPNAFKNWTKDWRDTEQNIRKWMEGEKPTLQSQAIYRDRMGRAALARAEAALSTARSNPHGLKQSDYDRAFGEFVDSQDLRSLQDEPLAQNLASLMSQIYLRAPQTPFPSIIDMVMQAHSAGAIDEIVEKYGLN